MWICKQIKKMKLFEVQIKKKIKFVYRQYQRYFIYQKLQQWKTSDLSFIISRAPEFRNFNDFFNLK